ncbi:MAG: dehydrogenase [Acidobacteria bacterium]|uniref:YciI family protein n=1 Tax=Candidatus Segetimicrobium genomatis TaxID=2569760 RepID=A0A537JZC7_9BACT|nr:MAG: dehydrogenase [Acidobacteriota bacterium]TMI88875.1 MAG: YciI family protein [Terrabacteria group bacterium ANGP1]
MRYVCLIYNETTGPDTVSGGGREAAAAEALIYGEDLRRRGYLIAAEALQSARAAVTVRLRNGRASTTEGPAAETGEQLNGFVLIEARDLNEAIQVASKMPEARVGSIEVRPIRESHRADRWLRGG